MFKWYNPLTWYTAPGVDTPEKKRSPQWAKVRDAFIAKNPSCAACGCKDKSALECHHAYPFSWPGGDIVELREDNLIVLCSEKANSCHRLIGHLADFASRNPLVRIDAALMLAKIRNRPYP